MRRGGWALLLLAGCAPAAVPSSPRVAVAAPTAAASAVTPTRTWRSIYATYLGPGSPGSCGRSGACHAADVRDAASAYEWLAHRGYIDGSRSALVSRSNSCLRWFGGNMPPRAEPAEGAVEDLRAWVAAGAPED